MGNTTPLSMSVHRAGSGHNPRTRTMAELRNSRGEAGLGRIWGGAVWSEEWRGVAGDTPHQLMLSLSTCH